MSDDQKRDPFKPPRPAISGIPADGAKEPKPAAAAPASAAANPAAVVKPAAPVKTVPAQPKPPAPLPLVERLKTQMMPAIMGLIALLIFAVMAVVWKSRQSEADDSERPAPAVATAPAADVPAPPAAPSDEPVAPGVVAKTEELAEPWAAKSFVYRNASTGEFTPAMIVHLPRGGYWGFSLIEPYGRCRLEYLTNLQKIHKLYEYPADHPLVADPCSHTLFDLLRYGGPMDGEVRGDIVHGSALRPPVAIEIQERGKELIAVKMEE
jgi:hypothetical protein